MNGDLREQMRGIAEEVPADPRIPAAVARRAARRRRLVGAIAGTMAVTLLAGIVVGVRGAISLLDTASVERIGSDATPPPTWRGIWPQTTREEAEAAQAAADAGDPDARWQLDEREVAERYALDVLGWDEFYPADGADVDGDPSGPGPVTMHVSDCPPGIGVSVCKGARHAALTVERLVRPDPTGIWLVTDAAVEPPAGSVDEEEVRAFIDRFMEARVRGEDADIFLDRSARRDYESGENDISLYSPTSNPHYASWEIVRIAPSGLDPNVYDVTVRVTEEVTGQGEVGSFEENLYVGPQEGFDPNALFVLSASRTPGSGSGEQHEARARVEAFVQEFMAARVAGPEQGPGAESFLSPVAKSQYDEGEASGDGPYLYGNPWGDPSLNYVGYVIERIEAADANSYEVLVAIEAQPLGDGRMERLLELLFVGPGRDVDGADRVLVVRGSDRNQG